MTNIRKCVHCKKTISIRKETYYTAKTPGTINHNYYCCECSKECFEGSESSSKVNELYEVTYHYQANKENSSIGFWPYKGIWIINDNAEYAKRFNELGAAKIFKYGMNLKDVCSL